MSNEEDKFAVAFYQELGIDEKKIAGHLPVEFSKIAAYFIENGTQISCRVTAKRKHSVKEAFSNKRHVQKLDALTATERIKILCRYGLHV